MYLYNDEEFKELLENINIFQTLTIIVKVANT